MATITTRAGKGSPLTNNEVDANFTNLNTDKLESGDLSVSTGAASGGGTLSYSAGAFTFAPADLSSYITDLSSFTTTNLTEGTNLYYTDTRARAAISVTDAGGDGSLSYSSGVITYTGPSATEVRAHFSAGTGVAISSGSVSIGQAVGTSDNVTFGDVIVGGDLTVNGTTTTVHSTTVTIDDPIFTLGGDTPPTSDDNKDRGIEFRWHNSSSAKIGFFGYDDSASAFTFIPDATNTAEVFSGAVGDVIFGEATVSGITLGSTAITATGAELNYTDGVTSNIQTQLNAKAPLASPTFTGTVTIPAATVTGNVSFGDNDKAQFGAGNDLQIYHDGSNSYIKDTGTGRLALQSSSDFIVSNTANTQNYIYAQESGYVRLYHAGATKLATTATGVDVTGTVTATTFSGALSGNATTSSSTTGNAATATTLQTARTINGVSFNGSANIVVESYVENDEATAATRYLTFVDNSTAAYKRLNEDSSLTYNPSTNTLTAVTFSGALSGNATTATNITGYSGTYWTSSNDGTGSGLDADLLDGQQGSYYYPASNPNGYTANVGDITGVTAGVGLSGGGTSGTVTLTVDLSELTDMTAAMVGTDEFIVLDASADRRKAANEIGLSIFNNDAGFTTNVGDITGVTAGSYLTGGGTSGAVTLNVDATSANTASKVVARDASGNFAAGTITAALTGNASTATTLQTARTINGVSFNGSANITVADTTKLPLTGGTLTGALSGTTGAFSTSLSIGSEVVLSESTDRADLLQISSTTSGYGGLQIRNSSNEGRWSFMTDGESAGIYNDEDSQWHILMTEAGGTALYYSASVKLATTSSGVNITGTATATTFSGALSGNATTATTLATARTINGVSFNGSANITVDANTTNTLTRGTYLTGSNFNGSAATTWAVDATTSATASKIVARDGNGYVFASYYNSAGTFSTTGATSGMGIFTGTNGTDTYGRSYTAAAARTLLNVADGATAYSANQALDTTSSPSFAGVNINGNLNAVDNIYLAGSLYHEGDTDTRLLFGTNTVTIQTGGSSEITVNTTGVRLGDTGNGYFQPVSGNYGSIQADGGAHGGWEGYNIGGRAAFIHDNSSTMGLIDDVNNEWGIKYTFNGAAELYYNATSRLQTTNTGANVTGTLTATAVTVGGRLAVTGPQVITANTTAVSGSFLTVKTAGITITLPASPSVGDFVIVKDGTGAAATSSFTVARNGQNIAASATNLTFDKNYAEITMTYVDATIGWSV